MRKIEKNYNAVRLNKYIFILKTIWTITGLTVLICLCYEVYIETNKTVLNIAEMELKKDIIYRRWNGGMGGVYVPVTASIKPNKYLEVPHRDVSLNGRDYTLMNPAFMTRIVHEIGKNTSNLIGHITSLNPIRSGNKADNWETEKLKIIQEKYQRQRQDFTNLEKKTKYALFRDKFSYNEVTEIKNKKYFRYIEPLLTEKGCLKCHAKQGYKEGDIRGGISVSIEMQPYLNSMWRKIIGVSIIGFLFWFTSFVLLIKGGKRLKEEMLKRANLHQALQEKEHLLKEAHSIASLGSWSFDLVNNELLWCDGIYNIFGVDISQFTVTYDKFLDFVHPEDLEYVNKKYKDSIKNNSIYNIEYRIIRKDGAVRYVKEQCKHICNEKGIVIKSIGTVQDITEEKLKTEKLKEQEIKLIKNERLATLGTLSAGIAHEINNPNNFISLNAPMLKDFYLQITPILEEYVEKNKDIQINSNISYTQVKDKIPKLFDGIINGSNRIEKIVRSLKDYSLDKKDYQLKKTDLNSIIEDNLFLLKNYINKSTTNFDVNYFNELPLIWADALKVSQVVMNLVTNACNALRTKKDKITISTDYDEEKDKVAFIIEDSGCGMSEEDIKQIYYPFFSSRVTKGGTGLGMSIVSKIVNEHNAKIEIKSKINEGTIVKVFFPVEPI